MLEASQGQVQASYVYYPVNLAILVIKIQAIHICMDIIHPNPDGYATEMHFKVGKNAAIKIWTHEARAHRAWKRAYDLPECQCLDYGLWLMW